MQIEELLSLHKILAGILATGAVIPEFAKDPFEMSESEIEKLYLTLTEAYLNPSETLSKLSEDVSKKEVKKTLANAENVESVQMSEEKGGAKGLNEVPEPKEGDLLVDGKDGVDPLPRANGE